MKKSPGSMGKAPAYACLAAALYALYYGVSAWLFPPPHTSRVVFAHDIASSIDIPERKPNPDERMRRFMPYRDAVLGKVELEPGGVYRVRAIYRDRRYDPEGWRKSDARAKCRFTVGNDATGVEVKGWRAHAVSRDAEKLTVECGEFRIVKAGAYVIYAESHDAKDVAEMARLQVVRVDLFSVYVTLAVALALAAAFAIGGILLF